MKSRITFFTGLSMSIFTYRLLICLLWICGYFASLHAQIHIGNLSLITQEQVDAFDYEEVTGDVTIYGIEIENVNAMSSLNIIGGFLRIDNTLLPNIDGLSNLSLIGGDIWIWYNDALLNVDGLQGLTSMGGGISMWENPMLIHIDGLQNLTSTDGRIWISSCPSLLNIDGLQNVNSIGRDLRLGRLPLVTNLDALANLTFVGGGLNIFYMDRLRNLDGLQNVTTVGISLTVIHNPHLINLNGLQNITSVWGAINIIDNPLVRNLDGLHNISSVLNGHLHIRAMAGLTNIDGLQNITSVGSSVAIISNAKLQNVDGLQNLTTIGDGSFPEVDSLTIRSNPKLKDLNGLQNLTTVIGDLKVIDNIKLKSCCRLYPLLSSGGLGGTAIIHGNGSGCTSEADIIASGPCGSKKGKKINSKFIDFRDLEAFISENPSQPYFSKSYPNPFSEFNQFKIYLPESSRVTIKVFDLNGKTLQTLADADYSPGIHEFRWNGISSQGVKLSNGIYIYHMRVGDWMHTEKMSLIR